MSRRFLLALTFLLSVLQLSAQETVITLNNPSFEDEPRAGRFESNIEGWIDCGRIHFITETPPDIHTENPSDPIFGVTKAASDGNTYLGLVTRENESWESVSQKLEKPLEAGSCYTFSIDLAKSTTYFNAMSVFDEKSQEHITSHLPSKLAILNIWGGNSCESLHLLASSQPVNNTEWETYTFKFTPKVEVKSITLEAFYVGSDPYFGHVLLDNASEIKQIQCD